MDTVKNVQYSPRPLRTSSGQYKLVTNMIGRKVFIMVRYPLRQISPHLFIEVETKVKLGEFLIRRRLKISEFHTARCLLMSTLEEEVRTPEHTDQWTTWIRLTDRDNLPSIQTLCQRSGPAPHSIGPTGSVRQEQMHWAPGATAPRPPSAPPHSPSSRPGTPAQTTAATHGDRPLFTAATHGDR